VCPGSLIELREHKASIRYPKDCWGCSSCIKECSFGAISLYLGADMGGMGSRMSVTTQGDLLHWNIHKTDGTIETITVNKKDSNKY
jgi:adenylylsulfate reductase subunit B